MNNAEQQNGIVFNVQHYSIHDGAGIRTVVFLKGCPLRCRWCGNPESQRQKIELGWTSQDCIGCGGCLTLLKDYGLKLIGNDIYWNFHAEPDNKRVKRACPSTALHCIGEEKSVDEIIKLVERDKVFYDNSQGGLTISGGEPLMQADFAIALLKSAKAKHINTCIETSAYGSTEKLLEIAAQLDYMFVDIKLFDNEKHKQNTGVSNEIILENIKAVRNNFKELPICVRTPIIPSVNDNSTEIKAIRDFVKSLGANTQYELLKYHRLGEPKYKSLHREYPMGDITLSDILFDNLVKVAQL